MLFKNLCLVCLLSLLLPRCAPRLLLLPSVDPDSGVDASPSLERSQVSDEGTEVIPDSVVPADSSTFADAVSEQPVVPAVDVVNVTDASVPDVPVVIPTDAVLAETETHAVDVVERDSSVVILTDVPVVTADVPRDIVDVTDRPSVPAGRCRTDSNCASGRCCAFPLVGQLGICGCPLSGMCVPPTGNFCRE